jgi:uncharacterized membrane protein YtjA (UPF0391 family)
MLYFAAVFFIVASIAVIAAVLGFTGVPPGRQAGRARCTSPSVSNELNDITWRKIS